MMATASHKVMNGERIEAPPTAPNVRLIAPVTHVVVVVTIFSL